MQSERKPHPSAKKPWLILGLVGFALLLLLVLCRPLLRFRRAENALRAHRYEEAVSLFESVIDRPGAGEKRAEAVAAWLSDTLDRHEFDAAYALYARYIGEDDLVRASLRAASRQTIAHLVRAQALDAALRWLLLVQPLESNAYADEAARIGLAFYQQENYTQACAALALYPDAAATAAIYKDCQYRIALSESDLTALYPLACEGYSDARARFLQAYPASAAFQKLSVETLSFAERAAAAGSSLTVYYDYTLRITNNGAYPVSGALFAYVTDYHGKQHRATVKLSAPLPPKSSVELLATFTLTDTMIELGETLSFANQNISVSFDR